MKRVTFTHELAWREPDTTIVYHVDEHRVLHVLEEDEPCDLQSLLVPDDAVVEPGDYWNGDQAEPAFSKEMFNGLGPEWDVHAADQGRAGFNGEP